MAAAADTRPTQAEFLAGLERSRLAVKEMADRMIAEQHEPRNFLSRRKFETIVLALVTVPERETHLSYWVSTDGDDAKAVAIPKSQIKVIQREVGGLFLLATMKAWLAMDRHFAQANIPGLNKARKWTDDERAAWKRIKSQITQVRHSLDEQRRVAAGLKARSGRRTFALRKGDTA